ncbi:queuosine precursor transporter [Qipengyuania sp. JC766]|uniref:queuosine precursor transporter n=1 Tax=Qipengyuania sp. JC766 TaxID=3232139 RepID=UPI00345A4144
MNRPASAPPLAPAAQNWIIPRGLFVMMLLYGGMTVLAGFLAFKQVQLWPTDLAVEAGIFAFLLLVVISSTVSQLYGTKTANRIVWWGFLPLAFSIVLMTLVLSLPPSPEMLEGRPGANAAFELVHGQFWRVVSAGPVAYLVSLLLNVWIFDKLRGNFSGGGFSILVRGAIASALSQAIDSIIFVTLAFYGEFDITNLLIGQVLAKVTLSFVLVPFLIGGGVAFAKWLDGRQPG